MPGRRIPGSTGGKRPWTACARRPERSAPEPNGNGRLRSHGENQTGPFGEGGPCRGWVVPWDEAIWIKDHLGKGSPGEGAACQRDQPVWYREDRSSMEDSPNSLLKGNP
jgi:hypothetical protein